MKPPFVKKELNWGMLKATVHVQGHEEKYITFIEEN